MAQQGDNPEEFITGWKRGRAEYLGVHMGGISHAVRDPNGRACNRTSHLAERRKMMQTWADYLDGLKSGAKVTPLKRQSGEK
jgi:hypothetical protein